MTVSRNSRTSAPAGTTVNRPTSWTVCQIGAREHYSISRALLSAGRKVRLITDYWANGCSLTRQLRGRYHSAILSENVKSFNLSGLGLEVSLRLQGIDGWRRTERRNQWFGEKAAASIQLEPGYNVVFSYSYAALEIFRAARALGAMTVLGQIDPGPVEQQIVQDLHRRHSLPTLSCPSDGYWARWREECDLADLIIVNSDWSRRALMSEGVCASKIRVIPLAYEVADVGSSPRTSVVRGFSHSRPLEVLFLGQVIARKGIVELIEAADLLKAEPVRWHVVGPGDGELLSRLANRANVIVYGPVARADAGRHYQRADVFILPTHSDGYALTQLEAAVFGLPIIASRNCGDVVTHGFNGLLLDEVTSGQIVAAIRVCLNEPACVARMSQAQYARRRDIATLAKELAEVEEANPLRTRDMWG